MAIKINWQDLLKRFINWQEIVRVYKNGGQIRPETVPPVWWDYLCFTAKTYSCRISLNKEWNPTDVSLEISYDKSNWTDYTIWTEITLANIEDKVYFRNKSETPTRFSLGVDDYYSFGTSNTCEVSGDVNYLLCKHSTTSLSPYCFRGLFSWCRILKPPKLPATTLADHCYTSMFYRCERLTEAPELPATTLAPSCYSSMFTYCRLTEAPELPATTLADWCYQWMFSSTRLVTPPSLPATTLARSCYMSMFSWCSYLTSLPMLPATTLEDWCYTSMFVGDRWIKLSTTQAGEYQTPYRIPSSWTWTDASNTMTNMFSGTWGTFTGTPNINQTYYTSNQVI